MQFDIQWNEKEKCNLTVWGFETYENEEESKMKLDITLINDDEYILRFGD